MAVAAIFIPHVSKHEVAIATLNGHIAVVTILCENIRHIHPGNGLVENAHLLKCRLCEINIDPVLLPVPFIRPPLMHVIHRERDFPVIHREHLLPREIACAVIEMKEVPEHEPSLPAAIGAFSWGRGTQLGQKFLIFCQEGKLCAAGGTRRHRES